MTRGTRQGSRRIEPAAVPDAGARKAAKRARQLELVVKRVEVSLLSPTQMRKLRIGDALRLLEDLQKMERFHLERSKDPREIVVRRTALEIALDGSGQDPLEDISRRRRSSGPSAGMKRSPGAKTIAAPPQPWQLRGEDGEPMDMQIEPDLPPEIPDKDY